MGSLEPARREKPNEPLALAKTIALVVLLPAVFVAYHLGRSAIPAQAPATPPAVTPGPTPTAVKIVTRDERPSMPQPASATIAPSRYELSGTGDTVTPLMEIVAGLYVVQGTHDGRSNFIAHLYEDGGSSIAAYLVNGVGRYDGKASSRSRRPAGT